MVKILMITPAFPPVGGSHVHRMINLANQLTNSGNSVDVLTLLPEKNYPNLDLESKNLVDENIFIHYVREGFFHRTYRNDVIKKNDSYIKNDNYKRNKRTNKIFNKLKKMLLIPDSMIDWFFSVKKYCKKTGIIEKIEPDLILTSSMPNTSHLIGYYLSKKYNIPLAMDYGDPWVFEKSINRGKIRFLLEKNIEKKIVHSSIYTTFATENTRKLYIDKYNLNPKKTGVYMMGFYPVEQNINYTNERNTDTISMLHGGALHPAHRNPMPFFEALNLYRTDYKLEIIFRVDNIGFIQELLNIASNNIVKIKSYTPFEIFMKEALVSDILILFGNSNPLQIPGKVFNYMATGKTILYIKNTDNIDPTETILKEYGNVVIADNTQESILNALYKIEKYKDESILYEHQGTDKINKYRWENVALKASESIINAYYKVI